ncbi:MAG: hypothetical protein ABI777_06685 [Betaproteobacteria bacterium]
MSMGAAVNVCGRLLLAFVSVLAGPALAQRVLVLSSNDGTQYRQALAGIQKHGLPVEAYEVTGDNDPTLTSAITRAGRDSVIIALGGRASALVARTTTVATTVNCMAVSSDDGKLPANALVVPLEVPIETHIHWLKRLLPQAHSVGLLYDPAQNERRASDVAGALRRAGFQPNLEPVGSPSALPAALHRLNNKSDVLQALPDTTVFAREHSRALLLFSFRNFIPLIGPNEGWVRAGSLYAIDWDYPDLGRYCLALGLRQHGGNRTPSPPAAKSRVLVNLRSAELLRVHWDADTLRMVERVPE